MKKISYYIIAIVVAGVLLVSFWVYQRYIMEDNDNSLFFMVERGSIQESVLVRGEVVPQKEFDLAFPFSGIVDKIFVEEGQDVIQNSALMKLETVDFSLEIEKLNATLAQNQASLNKLIAGATAEDLNVLETKVANAEKSVSDKELNLQNAKDKADSDIEIDYGDVVEILNDAYTKADDGLSKQIDELFTNDDSSNPQLTFAVTEIQLEISSESERFIAGEELRNFKAELDILSSSDFSALDLAMQNARNHLDIIRNFLDTLTDAVNNASGISAATISTYKTNINTARTNINTAISNINDQEQAIAAQKVTNNNNIDAAQESLNDAESALELAQKNLDFKKAGARPEDIEIAEAQIREIKSQIAIIREKIRKSTLYAPGPAKVTKILLEEGELFVSGKTAVSLSASGHKIQADISELEIGKIREVNGNDVSIMLDSFPGKEFKGRVTSVDPREIVKDGDKYYRVNVFLDYSGEEIIRSGMSADLIINVSLKDNVLKLPEFVIYRKENKRFVKLLKDDEQVETEVRTGIADGEFIEILSGLEEGDAVIVSTD